MNFLYVVSSWIIKKSTVSHILLSKNSITTGLVRNMTTMVNLKKNNSVETTISSANQLFRTLPLFVYNDDSVYQMERENIFAKNWIYAGRSDRLCNKGDYLSITIAGYP